MKGKVSIFIWPVFLVAAMAMVFSPTAAHSYYFDGVDIMERLSPAQSQQMHDFLESNFQGSMAVSPMGDSNPNNPNGDEGVTINDPKAMDGYTLLNSFGGYGTGETTTVCWGSWCFEQEISHYAILIDMEGNVVNSWGTLGMGIPAKMLEDGSVMVGDASIDDKPAPGMEGYLTQFGWDGEVIQQWGHYHVDDFGNEHYGTQHHDNQREGSSAGYYAPGDHAVTDGGITMWLDRTVNDNPDMRNWEGVDRWGNPITETALESDVVWQADWDGNIVWEWHSIDHFEADGTGDLGMGFDANAKEALLHGPQIGGFVNGIDWTHINCVSWLGENRHFNKTGDWRWHPENIILDSRTASYLIIVARYDDPAGEFKSGDIVWRVGPDFSADMPEHGIGQIIGPHHAHMIPKTLPGGGNIMVFDNGGSAGFGSYFKGMTDADGGPIGTYPNTHRMYSRVVEFDPVTLKVVWQYVQAKPTADYDGDGEIWGNDRTFFASHYSSAQRLQNGNTLICEGNPGRAFEVTPDGEVVWEFVNEFDAGWFGSSMYRAYRVPKAWVDQAMKKKMKGME